MTTIVTAPADSARSEGASFRPVWLTQAWLEPRFVVITLLAILASLIAERLAAPDWLILSFNVISYAAGGIFGAKTAIESLLQRRIDVDMLMILAALGAAAIGEWHEGALLLFLFSLSNVLQDYAIGRSRQAIRGLLKLYPNEARVRREGAVVTVPVSAIKVGDLILIEPGERIPVDGIVRAGRSTVDQAPITGESMPIEKTEGDRVFAGTLNQQGALDVEALQPASDTVLARIIRLVEEAQDSKAPTERFLDKFEQIYASAILAFIGLFIIVPPALGWVGFEENFYRAMVLMTVASPCALIISTPASFISAIAAAARGGVLFKGGAYLEGMASIKAIAFDKTGTLTTGKPAVTDIIPLSGVTPDELLRLTGVVEARSEHPLAKAIAKAAADAGQPLPEVSEFEAVLGRGVYGTIDGQRFKIGNLAFFAGEALPAAVSEHSARLEQEGKSVILVQRDGEFIGLLALADQPRPEARAIVEQLKAMGVKVAMLTGDNAVVANHIGGQLGVDHVSAGLMPADKVTAVKALMEQHGDVAMIGDGVNDAPALATASIGIAMGAAGTDVALETADLVLMGDRLELIPYAIKLSKKARRVVWQNITFSIAVIVVLIISTFAVGLALPVGVLGHEGSTVIVVLNGLFSLLIIPEIKRRRGEKLAV
jgi:Cd2+/Zn2+-exporting ATPase